MFVCKWRLLRQFTCSSSVRLFCGVERVQIQEDREHIANQLNIRRAEDCYSITQESFQRIPRSAQILEKFGSYERALCTIFQDYSLIPWKFPLSNAFWLNEKNQKLFVLWIQAERNIHPSAIEEWDTVTNEDIISYGGKLFLQLYQDNFWRALFHLFPDKQHQLIEHWKRTRGNDIECATFIVERIRKENNVKCPLDWLNLSPSKRSEILGELPNYYGGLIGLLSAVDPLTPWKRLFVEFQKENTSATAFRQGPYIATSKRKALSGNRIRLRNLIDQLRAKYSITSESQWQKLSQQKIEAISDGKELLSIHGSITNVLREVYPELLAENQTKLKYIWSSPLAYRTLFQHIRKWHNLSNENLCSAKMSWIVRSHPFGHYLVANGHKKLLPVVFPDEEWPEHCRDDSFHTVPHIDSIANDTAPSAEPNLLRRSSWNPRVNPTGCWLTNIPHGSRILWTGDKLSLSSFKIPEYVIENLPKTLRLDLVVHHEWMPIVGRSNKKHKHLKLFISDVVMPSTFERRKAILATIKENEFVRTAKYEQCSGMDHFIKYMQTHQTIGSTDALKGVLIVPAKSYQYSYAHRSYFAHHLRIDSASLIEVDYKNQQILGKQGDSEVQVKYSEENIAALSAHAFVFIIFIIGAMLLKDLK